MSVRVTAPCARCPLSPVPLTIPLPVRHQLSPLLQQFAAGINGACGVSADMRQGELCHFIRDAGALLCPGAKRGSESVVAALGTHLHAQNPRTPGGLGAWRRRPAIQMEAGYAAHRTTRNNKIFV